MVTAEKIADINSVKTILDRIKQYVNIYEEQLGHIPDNVLENINFQLCEIEDFLIGKQEYTSENVASADIRMTYYWKYIDNKCSFFSMLRRIKQYEGDI